MTNPPTPQPRECPTAQPPDTYAHHRALRGAGDQAAWRAHATWLAVLCVYHLGVLYDWWPGITYAELDNSEMGLWVLATLGAVGALSITWMRILNRSPRQ